jgi:hypothetical protein
VKALRKESYVSWFGTGVEYFLYLAGVLLVIASMFGRGG